MTVRRAFIILSLTLSAASVARAGAQSAARDTRLLDAARGANTSAAVALLDGNSDPNVAEPDGTTALHWAARNNDRTLVDRLIRAGARATVENRYGTTPIALACESGSAAIVERLLKAGVSANATGPHGETALHTCARAGQTDSVKVLLAHGAAADTGEGWRGQTPLMWAAAEGHPDVMRVLIEAGANVDARSTVVTWERQRTAEPRDKWLPAGGFTPLHFAARDNCVACARVLVSAGAGIDAVDPEGHTALVLALMNGHFDVAGALIEGGIDVNVADNVGRTALLAAVDAHTMPASNRPAPREEDDALSSLDIVTLLLDRGAHVDAARRAALPYRTKLDRGGDGVLGAGTTPLLRAAKAADTVVIRMLLEKGANAKATTRNGVDAVMMAANVAAREEDMTGRSKTQKDAIDSITLLLAAGADVRGADTQGRTAAHGAALWGMTDLVRFLHSKGAALDVKDKRGFTPLDAALGRAGGFGFDGRSGVARPETATLIADLLGPAAAAAATSTGPSPLPPGRTQDDDPDR
jgi:ankyrin repeat protein